MAVYFWIIIILVLSIFGKFNQLVKEYKTELANVELQNKNISNIQNYLNEYCQSIDDHLSSIFHQEVFHQDIDYDTLNICLKAKKDIQMHSNEMKSSCNNIKNNIIFKIEIFRMTYFNQYKKFIYKKDDLEYYCRILTN